jgi:short chain dehydrogenase
MKFSTAALFIVGMVATTTDAFTGTKLQTSRRAFSTRRSSSSSSTGSTSLNMVAEDAKVILVTGSSRGLGKSIALDLGKHGQKVVVNYVSDNSKAGAEATVAEIKALGGDAIAVQADSTYCYIFIEHKAAWLFVVGS